MRNRWSLAWTWLARGMMLLAALTLLLALLVTLAGWNGAKPWLLHQAATVLAREVSVTGPLRLSWRMGPSDGTLVSRVLPQLHFSADQIALGNPAWAGEGDPLLRAGRVELSFSPWSLLHRHWHITGLRIDALDLIMLRDAQQRKNWRFSDTPESAWSVELHGVRVDSLAVRYTDQPLDLDLVFRTNGPAQSAPALIKDGPGTTVDTSGLALAADVSGRYGQASVQGRVQGGSLPDLLNDGSVYPLQAEGQIGQVHAGLSGHLINPRQLERADLHLRLSGSSLGELYAATGVPLPASRPFSTEGSLSIARVDGASDQWDWRYTHFTGKVGESDFAGDARYLKGPPRNRLDVSTQAQLLRLADFFPAMEMGKASTASTAAVSGRVFSGKPMPVQRWARLDADIKIQAQRVELRPGLEWQDASTTIRLQDQVLTAAPLRFALAGGKGEGELSLDGRADQVRSHLQMQLHEVQVRQLFPRLSSLQASVGRLDAQAELRGTGNSIAAMLGSAEGEVKVDLGPGKISRFVLEAAGLNVANAVFAKLYQDQPARLLCGAADVVIKDGKADFQRGIVNTEDAVIDISGQVDLAREELALDIHPRVRKLRILSLRTPLYVRGTLARPVISASKEALAARAGAAAALALVAPVAAVIPLISPGQALPEDCAPHPSQGAAVR
ncbi:AsmA family protein [Herbaspirillum sp. NPDC087042]|uniref:AsmA family protein n=1 Tax=Herbaspirillum sp. NPDC087042 TaxID=3364004 RepID=UPI0038200FB2